MDTMNQFDLPDGARLDFNSDKGFTWREPVEDFDDVDSAPINNFC